MKTQIKKYGNSHIVVLSSEFMKFHGAKEGDWLDLSDCIMTKKQVQLRYLKDNFPIAYADHIEKYPEDKLDASSTNN